MEEPGIGTNGTFSPEISSEVARPPSSHPCSFQSSQEVQDVRLSSLFASLFHKFCISPPLTQSHTYSPRKLSLCPWKLNYILAKLPISSTCSQNFLHLLALTDTCHPAGVLYCEVYSYLASGSYWFFHTPEPGSGVGWVSSVLPPDRRPAVWSADQQRPHHLGACGKYRIRVHILTRSFSVFKQDLSHLHHNPVFVETTQH